MSLQNAGRPATARPVNGPQEASLLGSKNGSTFPTKSALNQEVLRNPAAVAAMRRELNLEFVHECAGGIRIHAELAQTFAEIGDSTGVCYALKRLFAHVKAAHPVFVELRDETSGAGQ